MKCNLNFKGQRLLQKAKLFKSKSTNIDTDQPPSSDEMTKREVIDSFGIFQAKCIMVNLNHSEKKQNCKFKG